MRWAGDIIKIVGSHWIHLSQDREYLRNKEEADAQQWVDVGYSRVFDLLFTSIIIN